MNARIRNLAQAEGVTTFRLLLAAFVVFLHRYSGQDDIVVGFPTNGRDDAEFARTVGYFVNPVVLRADLSGNPTFKALLGQVSETVQRALAYQELPFPLLVERLRPKRDPSHAPVFQASFAFQKSQHASGVLDLLGAGPGTRLQWGGLEVEHYHMPQQEGQFDLELEMADTGAPLFGAFKVQSRPVRCRHHCALDGKLFCPAAWHREGSVPAGRPPSASQQDRSL